MADGGLARKQEQFEDAQLQALDIKTDADAEAVLKQAKTIGLITDSVAQKIQDSGVKDKLASSFKTAKDKAEEQLADMEKDPQKRRAKAFRTAFRLVYGKFLLEHGSNNGEDAEGNMVIAEGELEHRDHPFMKMLEKVLRVKIDPKFGLKGRSELQSAIKRLREVEVARQVGGNRGLELESILEKAFGKQKTPDEMKKLEDATHDAEHKKTALEEDKKYFGGDDVKAVHKQYVELLGTLPSPSIASSVVTATSVRHKKATLDLKNNEKTKLGELKDLFAEKKIGEVQDKFLELEGLLPGYLASGAGDFEGKLAGKKSETELLKGTIDNYEKTGRPLLASSIQQEKANLNRLKGDPKADPVQVQTMQTTVSGLEADLASKDQEFERNRGKFKDLSVSIFQLEKFRDGLKTFRSEVLDFARGCEKAVELGVLNLNGKTKDDKLKEIEPLKKFFNSLNVNSSPSYLGELKKNYETLSENFTGVSKTADAILKGADYGIAEQKGFNDENEKLAKAKEFYTKELGPLVGKFVKAVNHGVNLNLTSATPLAKADGTMETQDEADHRVSKKLADDMETAFKAIVKPEPDTNDFKVAEVAAFYTTHLEEFLGSDKARKKLLTKINAGISKAEKEVKDTAKDLKLAKEAAEKSKDLTDAQAAKKIIGVLVAEQFPELSIIERNKLVTMILAGDVATLQTEEDYEQLANRAGAVEFDALHEVGLRGKLIAFQYKEGDKVVQPFKGLKPEDFKDWAHIEKLFNIEKLNHKNGFFLLAALEIFDQVKDPDGKVRSVQALRVEEKLKALLAKQLGVHERTDEAGISKIIDEAFKEQMKKVRPLVKAHFDNYEDKGGEFKQHEIELLNLKYDELTDKLRNKKINQEIYEVKLKALIKEAVEADVDGQVKFSQDSVAAGYWNSSDAQWIRDKAHDAGAFVGKKAAAVALGAPALIGLKGAWGATKLGASLGFHTVMFPFRAAKYPLIALAKPAVWAINLFRKTPWQPLPTIRQSFSQDIGRVVGYGQKKAGETLQGATKAVTETPVSMWKKVSWKSTKYADRKKDESELRAEQMKVLEEKAALTPVEVASSPFIDLAEYKEKIKALNEMVGAKTAFPAGHDVSAGHTEKAGEKKEEAHAHDKKDEHGHGKEAAGGHHS